MSCFRNAWAGLPYIFPLYQNLSCKNNQFCEFLVSKKCETDLDTETGFCGISPAMLNLNHREPHSTEPNRAE